MGMNAKKNVDEEEEYQFNTEPPNPFDEPYEEYQFNTEAQTFDNQQRGQYMIQAPTFEIAEAAAEEQQLWGHAWSWVEGPQGVIRWYVLESEEKIDPENEKNKPTNDKKVYI
jgi:hypothetical protein